MCPVKAVDQAEGLRKLLQQRPSRRLVFVSAIKPAYKENLLLNLAVAGQQLAGDLLILDASAQPKGLADQLGCHPDQALLDANAAVQSHDVYNYQPGIFISRLSHGPLNSKLEDPAVHSAAAEVLTSTLEGYTQSLIDLSIDNDALLNSPALHNCDVLILGSPDPEQVTLAYTLVKRLHQSHPLRQFKLLLTACTQQQASLVEKNLNHTCKQFLGITLELIGTLAPEGPFEICAQRRETVFELFPGSKASALYRDLAHRLLSSPTDSTAVPSAEPDTDLTGVGEHV